ncbi:MAG: NAD(P)H-dependent oxidoreductase subunit E [Peptostreptococcaceae bacterium]|nr:NAD(P)H-dependent oxidoreductase subunit E [Peptostreptococcaceae bacterium]
MEKKVMKDILTEKNFAKLDQAIEANKDRKGALMPILHEAQGIFGALPIEVQTIISEKLDISLAEIYGVVTFYSRFSLVPKGEYVIGLCLGTACYVKGAQNILDRLETEIGIKVGETSEDGKFTLEATRCLGCCGLAPVMVINDKVYGRLEPGQITGILKEYK